MDRALKSEGFEFFLPNDSFLVRKIKALHLLLVSSSPLPATKPSSSSSLRFTFTESRSGIVSDGIRLPLIRNMIKTN